MSCRKLSRICALFKAYSGERAWKATGDRLQRPHYLSRVDHERKIRSRKHRADIRKYSFVNRTIQNWNQLPAEVLGTLPCKPNTLKKSFIYIVRQNTTIYYIIYSLNMTTFFGQSRPSSGHQEPGYALYNICF